MSLSLSPPAQPAWGRLGRHQHVPRGGGQRGGVLRDGDPLLGLRRLRRHRVGGRGRADGRGGYGDPETSILMDKNIE